jgi:hypothetical protein
MISTILTAAADAWASVMSTLRVLGRIPGGTHQRPSPGVIVDVYTQSTLLHIKRDHDVTSYCVTFRLVWHAENAGAPKATSG